MERVRTTNILGNNFWPALTSLALGACSLLVLLFVVNFLRSGVIASTQKKQLDEQRAVAATLTEKMSAYETQIQLALEAGAREIEKRTYHALLARIAMLRHQAKGETRAAMTQASEAEAKDSLVKDYSDFLSSVGKSLKTGTHSWQATLGLRLDPVLDARADIDQIAKTIGDTNRRLADAQKSFTKKTKPKTRDEKLRPLRQKNADSVKSLDAWKTKLEARLPTLTAEAE